MRWWFENIAGLDHLGFDFFYYEEGLFNQRGVVHACSPRCDNRLRI